MGTYSAGDGVRRDVRASLSGPAQEQEETCWLRTQRYLLGEVLLLVTDRKQQNQNKPIRRDMKLDFCLWHPSNRLASITMS